MAQISFVRSTLREYPLRDKRLILNRGSRNLASTHFVVDPALLDRERSIKDADGHCLAFSAGPTFGYMYRVPPRQPDESRGFLNLRASGAFTDADVILLRLFPLTPSHFYLGLIDSSCFMCSSFLYN